MFLNLLKIKNRENEKKLSTVIEITVIAVSYVMGITVTVVIYIILNYDNRATFSFSESYIYFII